MSFDPIMYLSFQLGHIDMTTISGPSEIVTTTEEPQPSERLHVLRDLHIRPSIAGIIEGRLYHDFHTLMKKASRRR